MIPSEEANVISETIEGQAAQGICPMCGADLPMDAIECPLCGEPFSPEAFEVSEEDLKRKRLNKKMFLFGVLMVFIGGPGIAMGSWLHDLLQINFPAGYDNWDAFGWVNKLVASVGIIILVIGIVVLILSIMRERPEDFVEDQDLFGGKK